MLAAFLIALAVILIFGVATILLLENSNVAAIVGARIYGKGKQCSN